MCFFLMVVIRGWEIYVSKTRSSCLDFILLFIDCDLCYEYVYYRTSCFQNTINCANLSRKMMIITIMMIDYYDLVV